jgi:hypothetical protein
MAAMEQDSFPSTVKVIPEAADLHKQRAVNKVSEITRRVQSGVLSVNRKLSSTKVDETTIPDAFRGFPKRVSPRGHSWIDFAVSTYFVGLGVWFAIHGRGRAATAAFVNGAMVAGVSLLTDYEGDGRRPISFKTHGTLDAVQATIAGLGPFTHGFAGEPEAKYLWVQAAKEIFVIATTDWDAGTREARLLSRI